LLGKRKKSALETEASPDRYLITYSDLITLLLGLFVILYAVSQVDQDKYKQVTKAFSEYFKTSGDKVLQGGGGILEGQKDAIPEPILPQPRINKSLQEINADVQKTFEGLLSKGQLLLKFSEGGVQITLPEKLLFETGKAEIQPGGTAVLDSLSHILSGVQYQITVDGHTDSKPINNYRYESNWHLSSARALNVGYRMIQSGTPEQNVVIRGFGSQRPVTDNSTEANMARNRRVEITIAELPTNTASTVGYRQADSNINAK
jgi:chemotaxis protein MotB